MEGWERGRKDEKSLLHWDHNIHHLVGRNLVPLLVNRKAKPGSESFSRLEGDIMHRFPRPAQHGVACSFQGSCIRPGLATVGTATSRLQHDLLGGGNHTHTMFFWRCLYQPRDPRQHRAKHGHACLPSKSDAHWPVRNLFTALYSNPPAHSMVGRLCPPTTCSPPSSALLSCKAFLCTDITRWYPCHPLNFLV